MAGMVRGATRSDDLRRVCREDIRPCLDTFRIHQDLEKPETEGDALRLMAEQLAGKVDTRPPLGGGDANLSTAYDAIRTKFMANAEAAAQQEVALWARGFTASLYNKEVEVILTEVGRTLQNAEWASNAHSDKITSLQQELAAKLADGEQRVRKEAAENGAFQKQKLFEIALKEGRREALNEAAAQIKVWEEEHYQRLKNLTIVGIRDEAKMACQPNLTKWKEERLEELKREALRDAEAEARNLWTERLARREQELENQLDALVKSRNIHLIIKAANEVGLRVSEAPGGGSDGPKPGKTGGRRKKAAGAGEKRSLSGQTVGEMQRGHSLSRSPTPTPPKKGKPNPLYAERRSPSEAPSPASDRESLTDMISRVASPAAGMRGTSGSIHAPGGRLRKEMTEELALLHNFSDGELRGLGSSSHNPSNAMEAEPTAPYVGAGEAVYGSPVRGIAALPGVLDGEGLGYSPSTQDSDEDLDDLADDLGLRTSERMLIFVMKAMIQPVVSRLDKIETRLEEKQRSPARAPAPPGRPLPAEAITVAPTTRPLGKNAQAAPTNPPHPPHNDDDGIIPIGKRTWANVITTARGFGVTHQAMHQHAQTSNVARNAAAAQGRTPAGNKSAKNGTQTPAAPATTEVMVIRDGGYFDEAQEMQLWARHPQSIVLEVRSLVEKQSRNTIQVLGGRWSSNYQKTGNFIFVVAGDVPIDILCSYKKWLCSPFPGSDLVPNKGWTWAQLRGVPTTDEHGHIWEEPALLKEARTNHTFYDAFICSPPHWQISPEKIRSESSMALIAYADPLGLVTRRAQTEGIFMFGRQVKFVLAGEKPSLIQCGRCFGLGHNRSSNMCPLPKNAVRCHRCGGGHHSTQHDFECKGAHKVAGTCDCRLKCILCGQLGHNARSRKCPKRGDFAPPRLTKPRGEGSAEEAQQGTALRKGKGKEARVDDEVEFTVVQRRKPRPRRVANANPAKSTDDDIERLMEVGRQRADTRRNLENRDGTNVPQVSPENPLPLQGDGASNLTTPPNPPHA